MPDGIQVVNSAGITQIDDSFRTLFRIGSGSIAGSGSATFSNQTSCAPLIFVRPSADGIYIGPTLIATNSFTVRSNGTFDWIAYGLDNPVALDSSPMGIQVFNASAQVIYDSRFEAPRIQHVLPLSMLFPDYLAGGPLGAYPSYPYTITFAGWGTRPWICLNALCFFADEDGSIICATTSGTNAIILRCGVMWSGNTWTFSANNGSNGIYARSFPGGKMAIPIARRDI
jgi:hypothetical protein